MDYRVLGPLEVRDGDLRCEIGGPKQRTVIAVLVAAGGRPVPVDSLLQAVYGDDASPSSRRSLQTAISNLRQVAGVDIEHRAASYRLVLEDSTVDAAHFEADVARARAVLDDDPATAAAVLEVALASWRGPPFADVEAHGHLDGEIARLTEMQLVAFEQRYEAELALGRHRDVVAELTTLAAEHPWRERIQALHITALYRCGRQTEALRAFEQTRVALADGLGIEPSPELRELEHMILVHDRSLRPPTEGASTAQTAAGGGAAAVQAGVMTFLYTDIEGSTRLLRELSASYDDLISQYRTIAREAWERFDGAELATEGDGFVMAFARPDDALDAAVELQRALERATWPGNVPVRVRVGIHSGFAHLGASGYSALALHQGARVVGAAHGGQILVTGETVGRLEQEPDADLVPLGRFRVRDFDDPVELYIVRGAGLPDCSAAPRVPPAERHNIVQPTTTLVDRVDECRRLIDDVVPGRLVTLIGPGGVGKTRLAVEVGLALADRDDDEIVCFVDLAPTVRADLVDAAVADALGAAASAGVGPRERILTQLADRRVVLELDNCEHLAPSVAELSHAVLSRCPQVGLLATSRSPIGIRSERVHRIEPLSIDDSSQGGPAVELFEERTGSMSEADRADVAALCRELDGLPLAIELAAARARTVPAGELLTMLQRPSFPLTSVDPGLPDRHRSLARLLDWSIERLDAGQRLVLQRISVCVGGFDRECALALSTSAQLGEDEAVDHLWALVDASLVQIDPQAGETRYRLMTIVRRHVRSSANAAELDEAWTRLARHLRRELGPEGDLGRQWVARMANEIDNVREVVDRPTTPPDVALSLAWAVGKYHDVTNSYRTGIDELTRWESMIAAAVPERVAVLTLLADIHLRVADRDTARALIERAGEVAERVGPPAWDESGLARARADLALRSGEVDDAIALLESALARPPAARAEARLWSLLGIARRSSGDLAGAVEACRRELAAATASNTESFLAPTHANLAELFLQLDDPVSAARHQLTCLELARAHRQPVLVAFSMMLAARLLVPLGRHTDAARLQTVADGLLARAGLELYAEDAAIRDDLLDVARTAIGPEFDQVLDEGRALDPDEAADLAATVLAERGGRPHEEE